MGSDALKLAMKMAEAEVMLPSSPKPDPVAVCREEVMRIGRAHFDRVTALESEVERLKTVVAKQNEPAHVLAEAERLLREACHRSGYVEVCLHGNIASISDRYDGSDETDAGSLAEAYAALIGGKT